MPSSTSHGISTAADTPANLALSELALDAAIEIERFQATSQGNLKTLSELSKALSERGLTDLGLVPIYDRALAWPAPGSEDTELGVLMEPEVRDGETEVYTRVQA